MKAVSTNDLEKSNCLSEEQIKLLDYLGDLSQELSQMARVGGFIRIADLFDEAVTEAKAIR